VVGGLVAIAGGLAVVGLTPVFWPVLAGMAVAGLFDAFGVVAAQNIIQRRTPDHVRSRVSAALDAVVLGTMSLSFALGAPLVEWVGAQGVYLLSAGVCLIGAMLLLPTLGGVPDIPRRARGLARAVGGSPRSASRALRGAVERRSPERSGDGRASGKRHSERRPG
jgi:MFS family permease